ncbi:polymeric immunoglobulin receptor [Echinops telfairi]|uniref:polymeric immunoglobulin receptor n=1 Tax=Echinops telfairi TaxID=9371 RepID=UPI001E1E1DE7|nr:polymeric immunoglobulin receptor [Echinops telfairi]XP_045154049.1 polymeric immunoglobulin receptor [Echinops telfairi]
MTPLLLYQLLTVLPVIAAKSPIFGPQEVTRMEGSSASIQCYYPNTSVNRHSRKYWCRQEPKGACITLISSGAFVSKQYMGRANLTNFPEENRFVVDIRDLTQSDSGRYKCGVGVNNRGLSFDVTLEVSKGLDLPPDTPVYTENVGGSVTFQCPFKVENAPWTKALYKKVGDHSVLIIDSLNTNPLYKGRVNLHVPDTSQLLFTVTLSQLRPDDSALYTCKAGQEERYAYLQVLKPEPELVYGDLRGSISLDCDLGSGMEQVPKFLCRINDKDGCDMVINTLGKKAPDFKGRILLTPMDKNGVFSVLITGLKKEDAGQYLCGANPDGVLEPGWPLQAWRLFVNEETNIPQTLSVVKGVAGGSVAVRCPYNPKESNTLKYWCRWEDNKNGICPLLVESTGLVSQDYKGRLVLFEEPGNGTYTVILNQLTPKDAGFYWCLTNGNIRWRSTVELKIIDAAGKPKLQVPEALSVLEGDDLMFSCNFSCHYYSYTKYWCKWSDTGCRTLPSQEEGSSQEVVTCDLNNQRISLTLKSVQKADEGWYWCGVKQGNRYGETAAVYVTVLERKERFHDIISKANAAPGGEVVQPNVPEFGNKAVLDPKLVVNEDFVEPAGESKVDGHPSTGSAGRQGGSSTVLVSTLVPLALVLAVGAAVVGVLRARHRRNVDRISIRSYRTDISMSELENSRDLGPNDNKGVSSITQETSLGTKDDSTATTGGAVESNLQSEDPKKAKRSSKEEADMAYTAFLLQSNNIAENVQAGPRDA